MSNIGKTYKAPEGITFDTDQSRNYLAGSHKFKVKEVEAFKVIFLE
jgi:hypothetical protein